jgi:hypothetical protein
VWQHLKEHKWLYIIAAALVIVLFYPFTIFFRGTIVPLYANTFYKGSVDSAYHRVFDNLNGQLANLGIKTSEEAATCYNGVSDNGNAWFHYASETVPCMKQSETHPIVPDHSFKLQWSHNAPGINNTLLTNGWRLDSNTSLVDLYQVLGASTVYTKSFNKYECYVTFEYANYSGQSSTESNTKIDVRESCVRNVSFFGGYID